MQHLPISDTVRSRMEELTPSERKVARVLLAGYPTVGLQAISEIAEQASVSGPTVMRFVNRLGFEGYPAFQKQLLEELQARVSSPLEQFDNVTTGLEGEELLSACLASFQDSLAATFKKLPPSEFRTAVGLIGDGKMRVTCVGGRYSDQMAQYLWLHLRQIRPDCRFLPASTIWRTEELIDIDRRDVLVVFDFRRYQQDTVDFALAAAERGATIVLVTDPYLSPISKAAKCVLPTEVDAPSPFDTFLPAMALVEALVAGIIQKLGNKARKRIEALEDSRGSFSP